jgi:phage terminase large subunit-like protein
MLDPQKLALLELLDEKIRRKRYNKLAQFYPDEGKYARDLYPKHMMVFSFGATYRERCFQGGNGVGKTEGVGAYEVTLHATGDYPDWWTGRRYTRPTDIWVAGDTKETVRDITQTKLIGDVAKLGLEALGTGMIPRDTMLDGGKFNGKFRQGTNFACDFVRVKHKSGGYSTIAFKSYDQRRESFQGTEKDLIWLDEEPPLDIYTECVFRGRTVNGMILLTFTPLSGPTDVVKSFQRSAQANEEGASKILVKCRWEDVPHLTEEEKAQMLAGCPPYLRDARVNGEAVAGIGRVYPVQESDFVIKPLQHRPDYWPCLFGIDCGWHMTAAIWCAHDRDNDVVYVYSEHFRGEAEVPLHAAAIKARGIWVPGVGDVAGASQTNGDKFLDLYRAQGVRIRLPNKAVDAGIANVLERLSTGRLKIYNTCERLLDEIRRYSYDDKGKIKKEDDHGCDALRYALMDLDQARVKRPDNTAPSIPEMTFGL